MIRTVFGSNKSGTALIPILATDVMRLEFSTRIGDSIVSWGDGSDSPYVNPKNYDYTSNTFTNFTHDYTSRFNGNVAIKFLKGLKDVYSIKLNRDYNDKSSSTILSERYNITDIQSFFAQFPNLYSICINEYAYGQITRMSVIKGDLSQLPNSVERVLVIASEVLNAETEFTLNFSNYNNSSNLKFFKVNTDVGGFKLIGDLSKFPPLCNFLYLGKASSGSAITYTAGKVWASSFDTLLIPSFLFNFLETDAIFTDMANSITSAVGGKLISIVGWVTQNTIIHRNYITGLGFTISNILDTSTGTASSTTQKFIGDVAQIPSNVTFFKIVQCASGSAITYTVGKVWASSFDTLYLPISMSLFSNDDLLNDMKNSVTTAIGAKVIYLGNGYRTSASDSAVTYLTGLGFTISGVTKITVAPQLVLHADANTYTSGATWTDLSGNGNDVILISNYVKDSAYGGNIKFTAGYASSVFPSFDSKYFSLMIWVKMDANSDYNNGIMIGNSGDTISNFWNRFGHHTSSTGHIYAGTGSSSPNRFEINSFYNNTIPKLVTITFANGLMSLYSNGVLIATKTVVNPTVSTFDKLFLGVMGTFGGSFSSTVLTLKLSVVKLYNYPLSTSEVVNEFNTKKSRFGL